MRRCQGIGPLYGVPDVNESASSPPVSLDDLVAFSEELAALARAGIPFEEGLSSFAADLPRSLNGLVTHVGNRLRAGETLAAVIADESLPFPAVWRGVVSIGLRTGRLANSLEGLAATGRRIAESRRDSLAALVYPCCVVTAAYAVFLLLVSRVAPVLANASVDLADRPVPWIASLAWLGANSLQWAWIPPAMAVLLLVNEWWTARRTCSLEAGPIVRILGSVWRPLRQARRDAELATFAELLSLLLRERSSLHEAVRLAAQATGNPRLQQLGLELSDKLAAGQEPLETGNWSAELPPLLAFLLANRSGHGTLPAALADYAARLRENSLAATQRIALVLPVILTVLLGGVATGVVAAVAFLPIWELLHSLGEVR